MVQHGALSSLLIILVIFSPNAAASSSPSRIKVVSTRPVGDRFHTEIQASTTTATVKQIDAHHSNIGRQISRERRRKRSLRRAAQQHDETKGWRKETKEEDGSCKITRARSTTLRMSFPPWLIRRPWSGQECNGSASSFYCPSCRQYSAAYVEPAAVAADRGTAMAMVTEEGGVVAEAAVPTSFGAFAALNGAVETAKM